ncbi:MAG TPA: putative porin, partial [Flavitalea sp.]|nr:putative porin [Flavitalea sp.]
MLKPSFITGICVILLVICSLEAWAQPTMPRRIPRPSAGGGGKDSVGHRTGFEDSITIRFRYLDSSKMQTFDSSIYDFTKRLPIPWYHYHLGNLGNATNSMIFSPRLNSGLDPGFHAYDVYTYKDYETKFYNTTRPYSELIYQLGSRLEQVIGLSQTQNIR